MVLANEKGELTCWSFRLQVTLFSGFVSYQMVREAYEGHFTVSLFLFFLMFNASVESNSLL